MEVGIKETTELARFGAAVGNGIAKAVADGNFGLSDISAFFQALGYLEDAFTGIDKVPEELSDLSEAEAEEIRNELQQQLDIPADQAGEIVQNSLDLAMAIYKFYIRATQETG